LKRKAKTAEHHFQVVETGCVNGYPSLKWVEESVSCSVFSLFLASQMEGEGNRGRFWCTPSLRIVALKNSPQQVVGFYGHDEKYHDVSNAAEFLQTLIEIVLSEKNWQSIDFPHEWTDLEQIVCPSPAEMAQLLPILTSR
jgi:hypothetical protein